MTTELAEVQTEAPAASPEQAAPPTENTAAQTDESTQAESKTFTQAELDAIVQTRLAKQERQHLRELRELQAPRQPDSKPQDDKPPARDSFATDEQWLDARDEWRDAKKEAASREQKAREVFQEQSRKVGKILEDAARLPGFDKEAFVGLPIGQAATDTILESDVAHLLVHHLTVHPDVADRIAKLSSARQAAEIGRLEEKLSAPKPVKVPPQPIERVSGGGPVQNGDLAKLPIEQYIERRKAMGARWHRA